MIDESSKKSETKVIEFGKRIGEATNNVTGSTPQYAKHSRTCIIISCEAGSRIADNYPILLGFTSRSATGSMVCLK